MRKLVARVKPISESERIQHKQLDRRAAELLPLRGEFLGVFINEWRQRTVSIFTHKNSPSCVITVGRPFDDSTEIVCVEQRSDYVQTFARIEAAKPGTYVYR